jgi:hypothetical protein
MKRITHWSYSSTCKIQLYLIHQSINKHRWSTGNDNEQTCGAWSYGDQLSRSMQPVASSSPTIMRTSVVRSNCTLHNASYRSTLTPKNSIAACTCNYYTLNSTMRYLPFLAPRSCSWIKIENYHSILTSRSFKCLIYAHNIEISFDMSLLTGCL